MDRGESDESVMLRLAADDESALGELMGRWRDAVWRFVERLCGQSGCTEDVYQEVWTRVYLYRRRYAFQRGFRPYLFAIAVNCCRRAANRGMRRLRVRSLDDASAPPSGEPGPDEAIICQEDTRRLHQAISRLPPTQRAAVLLYLLFSADYRRIAAALHRSINTVRSLMYHALKRLRRTLGAIPLGSESQVDHERSTL